MNSLLSNKKLIKIIFIIATALFLWISLFGIFHYMSEMMGNGAMGDCIFNGQTKTCTMNLADHITFWKGVLRDGPRVMALTGVLSLILVIGLTAFFKKYYLDKFFERTLAYFNFFKKPDPLLPFFSFLRQLFSQGILNPKLY